MHPFWETTDVVSEVISLLSKADQARIAQVSIALWEIAIPYIWRDVPDIRHIFNLFPSDLWNKTNEPLPDQPTSPPPLNRELQESDWTRFLFHSDKTRTTRCTSSKLPNAIPSEIWSHSLFSASFPRLERLTLTILAAVDEGSSDILPLLLRSSLRNIELLIPSPTAGVLLTSTLRAIAENKTLSPEEIALRFDSFVGPLFDDITEIMESQTGLRRLRLSGEYDMAYLAGCAKHFPFLEELEVQGRPGYIPEIDYNQSFLSSLTTFTAVGSPAMIQCLLCAIRSNCLARLALTFQDPEAWDIPLESLTEVQRFRTHLVHLRLSIDMWGDWDWEDFKPLLNLAELQTFELEISSKFSSWGTPKDPLPEMIDAWPNLTRLVFRVPFIRITLTSLAYIAIRRPNLRELGLTFNACKEENTTFSPDVDSSRFTQNALELFDVMQPAFDEGDEEKLANLLRCWWPKARLCQTIKDDWGVDCALTWPARTKQVGRS